MIFTLPKHLLFSFLITAFIYLGLVSFINYPYTTLLKPIPIIFLILGVLEKKLAPRAKLLMIVALSFSLLGDIVLTLPISLSMELGIGCFLFAHFFYITLFLKIFKYKFLHLSYFLLVMALMSYCVSIILPTLGSLLLPVIIYFCILMMMMFYAFQVKSQGLVIGGGALCFALSDLCLSFSLFVYPQMDARIFVMTSYYLAQLLLIQGLIAAYAQTNISSSSDSEEIGLRFV